MRYSTYFFFLMILALSLAACENFFETQIELPVPDHEPVIALTGFVSSSDTGMVSLRITRTYGLFEEYPSEADDQLSGATARLFENGDLLMEFEESEDFITNYQAPIPGVFGGIGNTYQLEVSHPDLGSAKAVQTIPEPVPVSDISFRPLNPNSLSGTEGELEITLTDPAGEENFYEFLILQRCSYTYIDYNGNEVTEEFEDPVSISNELSTDPNLTIGYNNATLLVSDQNFDGEKVTLRTEFYYCTDGEPMEEDKEIFTLVWRTVTPDYFYFSRSLNASQNAADNPFAEPVSLYSNVEGGIGAFCMYAEERYEVD